MSALGKRIRNAREHAKLTQAELSRKTGINPITLWRIEAGRTKDPRQSTIEQIWNALRSPQSALPKPVRPQKANPLPQAVLDFLRSGRCAPITEPELAYLIKHVVDIDPTGNWDATSFELQLLHHRYIKSGYAYEAYTHYKARLLRMMDETTGQQGFDFAYELPQT